MCEHGINANQLFNWPRRYSATTAAPSTADAASWLPVTVLAEATPPLPPAGQIAITLAGGRDGLVQPQDAGLAGLDHAGHGVLHGGGGGGSELPRQARDLQHRQGCQFTSAAFTGLLQAHGIRISMDGRGRWLDNVFIERLWRTVKYEEAYLRAYDAKASLARYFAFYNGRRPHTSLAQRPPDQIYFQALPLPTAA